MLPDSRIRPFFLPLLIFLLTAFYACDTDEQEQTVVMQSTVSPTDFEGEWLTSVTYSEYENAVMRIVVNDDTLNGTLNYQQRMGPGDETNPASRYFFEGIHAGNAPEVSILMENGDEVGTARFTLQNGELQVQMLNRQDRLPEIFVLEKSGS